MNPKHFLCASALLASAIATSTAANAAEISVKITNLTHGMYYTPFLVSAHGDAAGSKLFSVGNEANPALEAMAEGGMLGGLVDQISTAEVNADFIAGLPVRLDEADQPAAGPLAPGMSSMAATIDTDHGYLSVVAMLLPTNDAFAGLDSWEIPTEPGTYTVYLNAYDAGTEANNEIIGGTDENNIPLPPFIQGQIDNGLAGVGGSGLADSAANNKVHTHRGGLGDDDLTGGSSDLNSSVHRWLNPVARLTVTVN